MDELDAKAALRQMGITQPSRGLIENWLKAARAAERWATQEQPAVQPPAGAPQAAEPQANPAALEVPRQPSCQAPPSQRGRSLLAPMIHAQGAAAPPPRRRKPGRPRVVASWFPAVAKTMADGTTLATALAINGLSLSPNEMRALYRNRTFKALYQEARRRYLLENWGRKGPSLRALLGRAL